MSDETLTTNTLSAQERWDETLDTIATAAAREMEASGLLRDGAVPRVRFHLRGFGRRLLLPVIDGLASDAEATATAMRTLEERNRRLTADLIEIRRRQQRRQRGVILIVALLLLVLGAMATLELVRAAQQPESAAVPGAQASEATADRSVPRQ